MTSFFYILWEAHRNLSYQNFWFNRLKSKIVWLFDIFVALVKDSNADFTVGNWNSKKRPIISNSSGLVQSCFSLNIQNRKNDASLYQNIDKYAKNFFFNFGADSFDCGCNFNNLGINPSVRTTVLNYTVEGIDLCSKLRI